MWVVTRLGGCPTANVAARNVVVEAISIGYPGQVEDDRIVVDCWYVHHRNWILSARILWRTFAQLLGKPVVGIVGMRLVAVAPIGLPDVARPRRGSGGQVEDLISD